MRSRSPPSRGHLRAFSPRSPRSRTPPRQHTPPSRTGLDPSPVRSAASHADREPRRSLDVTPRRAEYVASGARHKHSDYVASGARSPDRERVHQSSGARSPERSMSSNPLRLVDITLPKRGVVARIQGTLDTGWAKGEREGLEGIITDWTDNASGQRQASFRARARQRDNEFWVPMRFLVPSPPQNSADSVLVLDGPRRGQVGTALQSLGHDAHVWTVAKGNDWIEDIEARALCQFDALSGGPNAWAVPPPPSVPAPALPPPPPLPPTMRPGFKSNMPKFSEPNSEEKRSAWDERIRIIASTVDAQREQKKLEEERTFNEGMMRRANFGSFPSERQLKMKEAVTSQSTQIELKKAEIESCITKLIESGFWPIVQSPDMDALNRKYDQLRKMVRELHNSLLQVHDNFSVITKQQGLGQGLTLPSPSDGSGRPAKRRRTDEPGDMVASGEESITTKQAEEMQDTMQQLENRLSEVENFMNQGHSDMVEQLTADLDDRLQDRSASMKERYKNQVREQMAALDERYAGKIEEASKEDTKHGVEVQEIKTEVAALSEDNETTIQTVAALRAENDALRQEIEQLAAKHTEQKGALDQTEQELELLRFSLQKFLASRPAEPQPPPPPPPLPAFTLEPWRLQELQGDIEDSLNEMIEDRALEIVIRIKESLEKFIEEQNAQLCKGLWETLQKTLAQIQAVHDWIAKSSAAIRAQRQAQMG